MGELPGNVFNEENCEIIYLNREEKKNEETFWFMEKNKIKIKNRLFLEMLAQSGFRKFNIDLDYLFVFINNNVVEVVSVAMIKDFVQDMILNSSKEYEGVEPEKLWDTILDMTPALYNKGNIENLKRLEDNFNNDTITQSFIYFNNCYVEVTAEAYNLHDYRDLDKYIWRVQKIDKDFQPEEGESEFQEFIMRICREDENRFNALRSAIGYMLHSYKDPANTKAIIFMDEKIDDGSNGGCGKSLLGNAISKVRKSLRLDGKNFRFDRFSFQSYEPGTNIIEFNDVGKKFPFEMLFAVITEDIVIEKKNKDEVVIPFEYAPKVLLSTNYAIKGVDESTLRRQFIIEFSDHFNMRHTPQEEFGRRFFEDWDETDWNRFYLFMIDCLQYYLKNGLVDYERVNLEKKKLLESTSEEFVEFMEGIEPNKWHDKKLMYKKFIENYPEYVNKLRQYTFTLWINIYAKLNNISCETKRIKDIQYFMLRTDDFISTNDNQNEQEMLF